MPFKITTILTVYPTNFIYGNAFENLICKMWAILFKFQHVNTFRPKQNGRHFPDDMFKCFFLNENVSIAIKISLKFVPKGPFNNIPALVQIMDWRRPGDKPLSEPKMVSLPTHICVTRPQWVKWHDVILITDLNSEIHQCDVNPLSRHALDNPRAIRGTAA